MLKSKICSSSDISIRKIALEDSDIIYKWILDDELRKMIGTTTKPTILSHDEWMKKKILDKKNVHMMICYDCLPVGIIGTNDIDYVNRNANIYLYIGETKYRGYGIGKKALKEIENLLFKKYKMHKIVAYVRSYNIPSINLFKKNNYICEGVQKDQIRLENEYYDRLLFGKINYCLIEGGI